MKNLIALLLTASQVADAKVTWFAACPKEGTDGDFNAASAIAPAGKLYEIQEGKGDEDTTTCNTANWEVVDAAANSYKVTKRGVGPWYWPFAYMTEELITCKDEGSCGMTASPDTQYLHFLLGSSSFHVIYTCQPYWWFLGKDENHSIWAATETLTDAYKTVTQNFFNGKPWEITSEAANWVDVKQEGCTYTW